MLKVLEDAKHLTAGVGEINDRTQNLAAATKLISASAEEIRDIVTKVKRNLDGLTENGSNYDPTHANLYGKRILMAEDMMINAEILKQMLSTNGVSVDIAENGQAALDMFSNSAEGYYDAIFMDVRMPVMDGLDATKNIRKLNRSDARTIPIIALTANDVDADIQKSHDAGMNAHLSKPVDTVDLYRTLEELIR
ncbi:MAG: response regulator [Lachnospiraceae bacterium]|nr:response regulator [Lachnospiraceae bacterium]